MATKFCKICNKSIDPRRVKLGFGETCVQHSGMERYTSFISTSAKTDYETIIVRDPEVGKHLKQLSYT